MLTISPLMSLEQGSQLLGFNPNCSDSELSVGFSVDLIQLFGFTMLSRIFYLHCSDYRLFARLAATLGRYEDESIPCKEETRRLCEGVSAFEKAYPTKLWVSKLKQIATEAQLEYEHCKKSRMEWRKTVEKTKQKWEAKFYGSRMEAFVNCCGRQNAGFAVPDAEFAWARAQMEAGQRNGVKELLRALQSVTK